MKYLSLPSITLFIAMVLLPIAPGTAKDMNNAPENQPSSASVTQASSPARHSQPLYKRWYVRVPILLLLAYLAWLFLLYLYQDRMLFPIGFIPPPDQNPDVSGGEVLHIPLHGGGQVEGWYFPLSDASTRNPAPLAVYFHGNAELIDHNLGIVAAYHRLGLSVFLQEYRGYGRSAGKPSQKAILADAIRFRDLLAKRPEVDDARIIYHGRSLGGAVAAALAREQTPAALILDATFTSLRSMAKKYGAPGVFLRNPFRTDAALATLTIPIIIFHGARDRVVPVSHGRALARIAPHAEFYEYPCGHNDFPGAENYDDHWNKIARFLVAAGIIKRETR